jgi:ubiquinone/menaquinone biosynthesis C-methylase UbiE
MRTGTLLRWYALRGILKSNIKEGSMILDVGGYDGFISYNLKNLFPKLKITVVDIDKTGLQIARDQGLNTLCASVLELPINDNQVDIILCLDLIEHVKEDFKLIKEISRVLKKDGRIILTTPVQNGISFPFLSNEKNKTINEDWGHVRKGYSLDGIKKLFANNNLVIIETSKYFNFFSRFVYWFNSFSRIPLKGKSLLYRIVIRLEPYLKYGAEEHIVVGKKVNYDL